MSFRENGGDSFKTTCGALLSFILIMMIGLYGVQKYLILVERDDTLISEFSQKEGLSEKVFSIEETDSFTAFSILSGEVPLFDYQRYFKIEAYILKMDQVSYNEEFEEKEMLTVRNCKESDKQYLRLGEPE